MNEKPDKSGEKPEDRYSKTLFLPQTDFPMLARAYLDGKLKLDEMISAHIRLEDINEGFAALKRGETIRSVVMFP